MSPRSGAESESRAAVYQAASTGRSSGSVSPTRLTRKSSAVRTSRMTSGRAVPPRGDSSRTSAPGRRTEAVGLFVATIAVLCVSRMLDDYLTFRVACQEVKTVSYTHLRAHETRHDLV